jgi:5'(3')-deoxyribonucleotidase
MRIAIDIDSTLHHYWDILSEVSVRRFGIELPYEEQFTWGITRLRPEQLTLCIEESHSDEHILAGVAYPGAVQIVRRWHGEGHFVHVTSHRALDRHEATAEWLRRIGLPFDDLHCSYDKVSRCAELEMDLLIDDGPLNLAGALERGIAAATIRHPWNSDLCEEEDVICARDWPELERKLEPILAGARQGVGVGAAK